MCFKLETQYQKSGEYDRDTVLSDPSDVNTPARNFSHTLTEVIQRNIPKIKTFTKTTNKPWFNPDLHRLRRIRDGLYHRYERSEETTRNKVSANQAAYKAVRNLYVAKLRKAERQFYHQLNNMLSSSR